MNEEKYIVFEEYLQGSLSDEARLDFEKKLLDNPELASELASFREVQLQLATKFGFEREKEAFEENVKKYFKQTF
ncbi:hypothetical protein [Flavobacterium seoulense]|uniref:Anti-sigma factor n=1 Tax=Flavobacterium seoulense TaxID=1492738 RepID=A0A066WS85_9FLAO|nr:hypothetical protein [Flavobacterium seoulense]KDN56676.1 hypothetical protein FEM21_01790 [Flavobacterium seoulense]